MCENSFIIYLKKFYYTLLHFYTSEKIFNQDGIDNNK